MLVGVGQDVAPLVPLVMPAGNSDCNSLFPQGPGATDDSRYANRVCREMVLQRYQKMRALRLGVGGMLVGAAVGFVLGRRTGK